MMIKTLMEVVMPGLPKFNADTVYMVEDATGQRLIERSQAIVHKPIEVEQMTEQQDQEEERKPNPRKK